MADTLDMFGSLLTEIADGPQLGSHAALTKALMQRFAEKKLTLAYLAGPKMMGRSIHTLREHAREYGLAFPDYVPLAQRPVAVLMKRGAAYELHGDQAGAAEALAVPVASDGLITVPASELEAARDKLHAAWFVVRVVKDKSAKKPKRSSKKVAQNAA